MSSSYIERKPEEIAGQSRREWAAVRKFQKVLRILIL